MDAISETTNSEEKINNNVVSTAGGKMQYYSTILNTF